MSKLDLHLSTQLLKTDRSTAPLLGPNIFTKLSTNSVLQDPKISLMLYKKQNHIHSSNSSSSFRLSESPNVKNNIKNLNSGLYKLAEATQTINLPSIRCAEAINKKAEKDLISDRHLRITKSTNRLKLGIADKAKEKDLRPLPKYSSRNLAVKNSNKLKKILILTNKKTEIFSDNENLCGWETESILCEKIE